MLLRELHFSAATCPPDSNFVEAFDKDRQPTSSTHSRKPSPEKERIFQGNLYALQDCFFCILYGFSVTITWASPFLAAARLINNPQSGGPIQVGEDPELANI